MKRYLHIIGFIALLIPAFASAHETHEYDVNGTVYTFVVGSIGEPAITGESAGVEVQIAIRDPQKPEDVIYMGGLERTLKVEVSAGGETKVFDLAPAWGKAGTYEAIFIPSAHEKYTYTFIGTIDGIDVRLPFTCINTGHTSVHGHPTDDSDESFPLSNGVTLLSKKGAFGCPIDRSEITFPQGGHTTLHSSDTLLISAFLLSVIATCFAVVNFEKRKAG